MTVVQDILSKFQTPLVLWLGPKPFVFIDNPDDLEKVFSFHFPLFIRMFSFHFFFQFYLSQIIE